ncbi:hypothetical protein CRV24_006479 [Beauveria bassiana]|nr:hypothetical protein CRV24_006479 [Beauveria bassiana]
MFACSPGDPVHGVPERRYWGVASVAHLCGRLVQKQRENIHEYILMPVFAALGGGQVMSRSGIRHGHYACFCYDACFTLSHRFLHPGRRERVSEASWVGRQFGQPLL